MPLTVPEEGEIYLLRLLVKVALASPDDWLLHLYVDDVSIEPDTELADLTEASYSDYAPIELARDQWGEPTIVSGRAVSVWAPSPVWFEAPSSSQAIYGWYVTNADDDTLLFGDRFPDAPITIDAATPIPLTPMMRLTTEYPPIT